MPGTLLIQPNIGRLGCKTKAKIAFGVTQKHLGSYSETVGKRCKFESYVELFLSHGGEVWIVLL